MKAGSDPMRVSTLLGVLGLLLLAATATRGQSPELTEAWKRTESLYSEGRYAEGELVARGALERAERELGPEHPDLAPLLNYLAGLYQVQGRTAEAAPLYRRSLAISEKTLGPEHPVVAQSPNNLATLHYAQGRYAEAEQLHRRALAIKERGLGSDHPSVAATLKN
jgi:tetratricopeptide (TPR) repeat protein